jgi:hypothetical protein
LEAALQPAERQVLQPADEVEAREREALAASVVEDVAARPAMGKPAAAVRERAAVAEARAALAAPRVEARERPEAMPGRREA